MSVPDITGPFNELIRQTKDLRDWIVGLSGGSDPGFDALLGWDDTDDAYHFIALGSGLSYDHSTHTLSSSGSGGESDVVIFSRISMGV